MAISHAKSNPVADFTGTVTVFNSQGSTATVAATDLVRPVDWNSGHNITSNFAGNTLGTSQISGQDIQLAGGSGINLSANGSTVSVQLRPMSEWQWTPPGAYSLSAMTQSSASVQEIYIPYPIAFTRIAIPCLVTATSSAASNTAQINISSALVIWSNNASTLSPIVGAQGTATYTCASNSAGWSQATGGRLFTFPVQSTLTPGEYWVGFGLSTNTASFTGGGNTTSIAWAISVIYQSTYSAMGFYPWGTASSSNANFWRQQGIWTTQITNTTRTVALSDVVQTGVSHARAAFNLYFEA